jgi:hypothetical protein
VVSFLAGGYQVALDPLEKAHATAPKTSRIS